MQHLVASLDEVSTAQELAKSVTLMDAIRWINQAWMRVSPLTIQKCFRHCGIGVVSTYLSNLNVKLTYFQFKSGNENEKKKSGSIMTNKNFFFVNYALQFNLSHFVR